MTHALRRSGIAFLFAVLSFTILSPIVPVVPTAHALPHNSGIDANGQWTRPGPGIVQQETGVPGVDTYIIRHQAPPLALYRGDIPGLAPTSPSATGAARLDVDSAASQAYLAYVAGLHADMVSAIENSLGRGALEVVHRYDAAINGVAVRMTAAEAQQISTLSGIRSITRDYSRQLHTDNGPKWIGADAIWASEPPKDNEPQNPDWCAGGNCGEGVVAGIIDTGVNFNHPSFAEVGGDGYVHSNPRELAPGVPRYYGKCATVAGICNDKLIGYYDFTGTSPEDDHGHGSHTASTTAGNVLNITLEGETIELNRSIAGVAPHANIISYKGCSGTPAGCLLSALIGAINQATLDEVDVINYSIGGTSANPWADLDAQAFLGAYNAGIFVATSASNDGPGFGTLGSPADAPWVTSVGANTHDRKLANGVVAMAGGNSTVPADIIGKGITAAYPSDAYDYLGETTGTAPIVYAGDYSAQAADPSTAHLCGAGAGNAATGEGTGDPWPAGTFDGEIVVCDRGEYGRVFKGEYVRRAGAGGFVLVNDAANGDSLVADNHTLPGVHISFADGEVLKAWLADGAMDHAGRIAGLEPGEDAEAADVMASFSSRGANPAAPSLVKPDVTAPGVDILAAWMADPAVTAQDILLNGSDGEQYNIISGTSMSSPHTAGAGALVRAVNPDWSPDEVKSALMTTAFTTIAAGKNGAEVHDVKKENGVDAADPFDMGAGRIDLHVAADAGFIMDIGVGAGVYEAADPGAGGDVTTLNIASLGNADCGSQNVEETCSWERTLKGTNGGGSWMISYTHPAGGMLSATDAAGDAITSFSLVDGEEITLTFTADVKNSPKTAPNGGWLFGEVRFASTSAAPDAHFPVAVIPNDFGGNSKGLKLYFHGNPHDDGNPDGCTYSGVGSADVTAGCGPFMSPDAELDPEAPSAKFANNSLNGGAAQSPYDPNWIWRLDEDTTLLGNMSIEFWASSPYILGAVGFDIELFADGTTVQIWEDVDVTFSTAGVPQLQKLNLTVNEVMAENEFVLKMEARFVDTGQGTVIYYDSVESCTSQSNGPCDSRVTMPVVTGDLDPIANDDEVFLTTGEQVVVDVLANDSDPDGDSSVLAVEIIQGPSNGTADVTQSNSIVYKHDGTATESDTLAYQITDVQGLTDTAFVNFTIATACYSEAGASSYDFEDGADGWTVDTAVNLNPASQTWQLTVDPMLGHSPIISWFTDSLGLDPEAALTKDDRLVSPEQLVSDATHLTFVHRFSTEDTYDGGVLEVSTDGGATWVDVEAAGGEFVSGGYNSTITQPNNRRAWGGNLLAMQTVDVDLGVLKGKAIKVRFRMLQDNNAGGPGWWIDDVAFSNLLERCPGQAPVANDDTDTVNRGGTVNTDVKFNDSDPDDEVADLTVTIISDPAHGMATVLTDGSVTYTHDSQNSQTSDSYTYKLQDDDGNFDTAIVNITIEQVQNEAPVANGDTASVNAGESVTIDVISNDSDADHPTSSLTITISRHPDHGTATPNGQKVVYEHDGVDLGTEDSFEYFLTDPAGAESDPATVAVGIVHENGSGFNCRNDLCADDDSDKPEELTMTFVGGDCNSSNNSQGSKSGCTDYSDEGPSGVVFIRATNKEDDDADSDKVYFEANVTEGEDFTISSINADDNDLGSKIFVHIYTADGSTLLQTIEIHTSCSAPLVEGDQFGSLMLGDADTDRDDPICTVGEGRVHGSGYWDTDNDNDDDSDKIDFSFDAKVYKGGHKGKLKIRDKYMDLKIDAKTITSLSTGNGEDCDGMEMAEMSGQTFLFTATGKMEVGDNEVEDAEFRACGSDNGKNKTGPYDSLFVECISDNCLIPDYNTATGSDNDIAGGNIHLHDAISDPVTDGGSASANSSDESVAEGGAAPEESGSATESSPVSEDTADSEEPGSTDVVTLTPMLVTEAPAGLPMVVTAIVETHGDLNAGTPVTLRWITSAGLQGESTALVNDTGIAAFVVTVPEGDVEYSAWAGDVESNGMRINGF